MLTGPLRPVGEGSRTRARQIHATAEALDRLTERPLGPSVEPEAGDVSQEKVRLDGQGGLSSQPIGELVANRLKLATRDPTQKTP